METLFRNQTHSARKSHDCLIIEIKGKKVKITYESYNAVEKCNTEIFDGYKWNHFLSMLDMGFYPESSSYCIWNDDKRKKRAEELFEKSIKMCSTII